MNCIVIDDEKMSRTILKTLCAEFKDLTIVKEFSNSMEAFKFLHSNEIDLIFLDIHMPGFTGLDFIKTLKNPPKVIFTSGDPKFAIDAFEFSFIVDYILKPVTAVRFEKAIKKAKKLIYLESLEKQKDTTTNSSQQEEDYTNDFYVNIDRRLVKIDLPTICYVQAKGDYIFVKTDDNEYEVHASLKKIEQKLPTSLFLKVHRSYIINVKKIIDIEDNSVLINKDVIIPVSRSNRPDLMKRLDLL